MTIKHFNVPRGKFLFRILDQRISKGIIYFLAEFFDEDCTTKLLWYTEAQLFYNFRNLQAKIIYDNFLTWYHQDRYSNNPDYFHTNLLLHQHSSVTPTEFRLVPDLKFFKGRLLALLESFINDNKFSFQQGFLDKDHTDRLMTLLEFWDCLKISWSSKNVPYYIYPNIITFKSVLENNGSHINYNNSETQIHCLVEPYISEIQGLERECRRIFLLQFTNPLINPNYGLFLYMEIKVS